ncbi:MAG: type 4 pilus major pilin, partial [Acidiphilium sp.]|nr:type 4 pilus major pilin [Acidiphilium sp.]
MWNIIAVLLVLAIVAVGVVEAYQQYGGASSQQQAQDLSQEVAQSIGAINGVYTNPDFTNLTNQVVYNIKAAPSDWQGTGTAAFVLPEGGTASFAPASVNGGTDNGYTLTLSKLNAGECAVLGSFTTPDMASAEINSTTASNPAFSSGSGGGTG